MRHKFINIEILKDESHLKHYKRNLYINKTPPKKDFSCTINHDCKIHLKIKVETGCVL